MALKPSTTFARWIKANSARLATENEEFKFLVTQVSFTLDALEMTVNRKGVAQHVADNAVGLFNEFRAEARAKGYELPEITMPKIKVVQPKKGPTNG